MAKVCGHLQVRAVGESAVCGQYGDGIFFIFYLYFYLCQTLGIYLPDAGRADCRIYKGADDLVRDDDGDDLVRLQCRLCGGGGVREHPGRQYCLSDEQTIPLYAVCVDEIYRGVECKAAHVYDVCSGYRDGDGGAAATVSLGGGSGAGALCGSGTHAQCGV